jgi:hypothetical protein
MIDTQQWAQSGQLEVTFDAPTDQEHCSENKEVHRRIGASKVRRGHNANNYDGSHYYSQQVRASPVAQSKISLNCEETLTAELEPETPIYERLCHRHNEADCRADHKQLGQESPARRSPVMTEGEGFGGHTQDPNNDHSDRILEPAGHRIPRAFERVKLVVRHTSEGIHHAATSTRTASVLPPQESGAEVEAVEHRLNIVKSFEHFDGRPYLDVETVVFT